MTNAFSVQTGDSCIYVDGHGVEHAAIVTWIWDVSTAGVPGVNLAYVDKTAGSRDTYGQQLVRETSVVHQSQQPAHGRFWKAVNEGTISA